MDLMELFFISLGSAVVVYYGVKVVFFTRILFPKLWFPLSKSFFTSMGEWAVVTGSSDGIGKAYAIELAGQGMNVVIVARTKEKLEMLANEISETTGQKVIAIVGDLTEENVMGEVENKLKDLNIGVLVNNVGVMPSRIPCKYLDTADLEQTITHVINCNVRVMAKMCKIVLPGMEKRGKGVILNVSSGMTCFISPLYTLYTASKVFVERFSQGLQTEYKSKGILIQVVAPFGVSTPMTGNMKANVMNLTAEDFVKTSLQYLRAGDRTYGSITHTFLGWILQSIPLWMLHSEYMQDGLIDFVKKTYKEE